VLFAHGEGFDVDAFLPTTTLAWGKVWRRDEPLFAGAESRHTTSGVELTLGDGLTLPLREQERLARAFLAANRDALRALSAFPGARHRYLRLQKRVDVAGGAIGIGVGPSLCFMRALVDAGFEPHYYVAIEPVSRPRPQRPAPPP
jgi:hypothetical protein